MIDGSKIGERRRKLKLKQKILAREVGITQSRMSNIEVGKSQPSVPLLFRIAKVLNVKVDDLKNDEEVC